MGARREGPDLVLVTPPSISPASPLVVATASSSTNSLRNRLGSSVPPFLVVCLPSWVCRSVRMGSCGIGSIYPFGEMMAGGHLRRLDPLMDGDLVAIFGS